MGLVKAARKEKDSTQHSPGGHDFLTCVPVVAVPGSEVVLYNILDKCSGPLAEDWASGRSEEQ